MPTVLLECQSAPVSEPAQSRPPRHLGTVLSPSLNDPMDYRVMCLHLSSFSVTTDILCTSLNTEYCLNTVTICSIYILWQCLSFPDHQMLHRENPGFSLFHSCWGRPSKLFRNTVLHSLCLFDTHTFVPGQRTVRQM